MAEHVPRNHQGRAIALTRAVEAQTRVETEVAVPESSRWIDAVLRGPRVSEAWGVIRPDLVRRDVLLEHFSRPPSGSRMGSTVIKAAWATERWVSRRWEAPRAPLTLVLSVGRPVRAMRLFGFQADHLKGIYRASLGTLELLLVDVRSLPDIAGTRFLRAFDHRAAAAKENLRRLFHDPHLTRGVKIAIGAAVMNEPALWRPEERQLTAQELIALGEERGRVEGRVEGRREEARRLLRRLLTDRLGSLPRRLKTAISACAEVKRLERALSTVAQERDDAELARAVAVILAPPDA